MGRGRQPIWQGQTRPKFWCQQEGLITMVICCKFKKNLVNLWLYAHLFTWFNKCIYPQVRGRQSQGTKFWCQQKPLVTSVICYKYFILILYNFFMILYMYVVPWQGLTTPWGRNFDVNRNILSLRSFVASFKKNSLKSDFILFFHDFIHVYSPGAGVDSPHGTKFWCQQKCQTSLHSFVASFKKCLWSLILYIFFHDLIHVYSPGAGSDSPQGTKVWCQQKALSLYPFVASFKEISLKSDFTQFFSWFNTCI